MRSCSLSTSVNRPFHEIVKIGVVITMYEILIFLPYMKHLKRHHSFTDNQEYYRA